MQQITKPLKLVFFTLFLTVGCQPNLDKGEAKPNAQIWGAEISETCAPFDGAAFMVSIKPNIIVFIYKAPLFNEPTIFTFPADSQTGDARLLTPSEPNDASKNPLGFKPLTGQIRFDKVSQSEPVVGDFNFVTPQGDRKQGTFRAIWKHSKISRC